MLPKPIISFKISIAWPFIYQRNKRKKRKLLNSNKIPSIIKILLTSRELITKKKELLEYLKIVWEDLLKEALLSNEKMGKKTTSKKDGQSWELLKRFLPRGSTSKTKELCVFSHAYLRVNTNKLNKWSMISAFAPPVHLKSLNLRSASADISISLGILATSTQDSWKNRCFNQFSVLSCFLFLNKWFLRNLFPNNQKKIKRQL